MPSIVNVFNDAEVIYQDEEYFDAFVVSCDDEAANEILIQQGTSTVSVHANMMEFFIKSMRRVVKDAKERQAARSKTKK